MKQMTESREELLVRHRNERADLADRHTKERAEHRAQERTENRRAFQATQTIVHAMGDWSEEGKEIVRAAGS